MGLKQGFTQVHEPCIKPWEKVAVFHAGLDLRRARQGEPAEADYGPQDEFKE